MPGTLTRSERCRRREQLVPDAAMWWGAGGVVGGWAAGALQARYAARASRETLKVQSEAGKAQAQVALEAAAFEGYDELVSHYRSELERVEVGMAALRQDHADCQHRLTAAERDMDDLRGDLNVLRGLVVTQIQAEADKDKGGAT